MVASLCTILPTRVTIRIIIAFQSAPSIKFSKFCIRSNKNVLLKSRDPCAEMESWNLERSAMPGGDLLLNRLASPQLMEIPVAQANASFVQMQSVHPSTLNAAHHRVIIFPLIGCANLETTIPVELQLIARTNFSCPSSN